MGKGGGMATLSYSDLLVQAQQGLQQGYATSSTAQYVGGAIGGGLIGGWNLGYSPSTNTIAYYQSPQPNSTQTRNLPILERLRSEIKDWHGEVLKV